jgi:hypothetical protein
MSEIFTMNPMCYGTPCMLRVTMLQVTRKLVIINSVLLDPTPPPMSQSTPTPPPISNGTPMPQPISNGMLFIFDFCLDTPGKLGGSRTIAPCRLPLSRLPLRQ